MRGTRLPILEWAEPAPFTVDVRTGPGKRTEPIGAGRRVNEHKMKLTYHNIAVGISSVVRLRDLGRRASREPRFRTRID
jgi:hypothetical protein